MIDQHYETLRQNFKPKYNDETDVRIYNEMKRIDKILSNKTLSKKNKEELARRKSTIIWLLKKKK